MIEKGEQPIATAKRELREEAGLEANEWQPLFSILPTSGFCNEELFLCRARRLRAVGTPLNADEQIEVHWKLLEEVLTMAADRPVRFAMPRLSRPFSGQHTPAVDMHRPQPFRWVASSSVQAVK